MKTYEFTVIKADGTIATFKVSGVNLPDNTPQNYVSRFQKQFPKATVTWKEIK